MDSKLQQQLDMYENGDLEALEDILTPSTYSAPPNQKLDNSMVMPDNDQVDEVTIVTSEQTSEVPEGTYPSLTNDVKSDISELAKEWIKIDETLEKIRKTKNQLDKQKKGKEQALLLYIEKYGLRDITKGRHQLVPQIQKGKKKSFSKKTMQDKLSDFLGTLEISDEADEIALQAIDYMDNTRETGKDIVTLKHNRL